MGVISLSLSVCLSVSRKGSTNANPILKSWLPLISSSPHPQPPAASQPFPSWPAYTFPNPAGKSRQQLPPVELQDDSLMGMLTSCISRAWGGGFLKGRCKPSGSQCLHSTAYPSLLSSPTVSQLPWAPWRRSASSLRGHFAKAEHMEVL